LRIKRERERERERGVGRESKKLAKFQDTIPAFSSDIEENHTTLNSRYRQAYAVNDPSTAKCASETLPPGNPAKRRTLMMQTLKMCKLDDV
jgi:hypothetical protein